MGELGCNKENIDQAKSYSETREIQDRGDSLIINSKEFTVSLDALH